MSATATAARPGIEDAAPAYLAVDRYVDSVVSARALKTAFEIGLVDHLVQRRGSPLAQLAQATRTDARGLQFLLGMLSRAGVVDVADGTARLDAAFADALRFRDLLETKLDFAGFLLDDFADHFTALIRDPARFVEQGRLFELFDYRRALKRGFDDWRTTRAWMRLTSTLTRYEAQAFVDRVDLSRHRRLLDVGGNSGEFALRLCRAAPALRATVFDLPLVCEIGVEHLLVEPEASRIGFVAGDLRDDALPGGHDLVTFKSMLHDWPQDDADRFVAAAVGSMAPGGTLAIFERGPIDPAVHRVGFADLPVLLFFRSYRPADAYLATLSRLGLVDVSCRTIDLDTPFFLITATKPG